MMWWTILWACTGAEPPPPPAPPLVDQAPPGAQLATYREMWSDRIAERSSADGAGRFVRGDEHSVVAGTVSTFSLRYVAGPEGVAVGGALTFVPEPFWGWSPPQTRRPDAPGFVEVVAPDGVRLEATEAQGQLVLEVVEGPLPPDAEVTLRYTGRVDRFAEPASGLYLGVDGDGDGVRGWVRHPPTVRIDPGPATRLVTTLPTTSPIGAPMRLTVAALDAQANGGAAGIDTVELLLPPGWTGPEEVTLVGGVGRATVVPTVAGVGHAAVRAGSIGAATGPVIVRSGAPRILWADLQIHTGRSDGTGDPATAYRYARDIAGLDVAAVTDHDRFGMTYLDAEPALWDEAKQAADTVTREGFVAFPAYEWTNWVHGHRHVLYVGDVGPVFSSLDPATDTPTELWDALRPFGALTIPHHPGGGPVPIDWSFAPDPELEPVVEVTSVHGQSESTSMPQAIYSPVASGFVDRQLQGGVRLGLIGSSDGHDGHPGLSHLVGGKGGLAALVDAEPTREGVAEALRARRVYGTNGVRSFLRFEANGQPMGSVLPPGPANLELRLVATADIVGVELVGKDGVVERVDGEGSVMHRTWTVEGTQGSLYYVRVVQADGGLAWSSPVWFDGG